MVRRAGQAAHAQTAVCALVARVGTAKEQPQADHQRYRSQNCWQESRGTLSLKEVNKAQKRRKIRVLNNRDPERETHPFSVGSWFGALILTSKGGTSICVFLSWSNPPEIWFLPAASYNAQTRHLFSCHKTTHCFVFNDQSDSQKAPTALVILEH